MTLTVERATREPETIPDVWLAFAPVKRAQTDWLVEKATELGVARLIPVITQRTIAERVKLERLRSHRDRGGRAMRADRAARDRRAGDARQLLLERDRERTLYFADESGGEPAATAFKPGPAAILIGPEGGFTDEERAAIRAVAATRRRSRSARASCAPRPPRSPRSPPGWRWPATGVTYRLINRNCWRALAAAAKRAPRMTQRTDTGDSPPIESRDDLLVGVRGRREAARATGASAPSTRSSSIAAPTIARRPTTSPAASATC